MPARTIALCSNTAWNLAHFRRPILERLLAQGQQVVCLAPADESVSDLLAMGCSFQSIHLPAHGRNPISELALLLRMVGALRGIRPNAVLTFTVKPNIYGALAGRLLGIPVVCNISGLGTAFLGRRWLGRAVRLLYRISLRSASRVFFQNPDDRLQFIQEGLVRVEQTALLPGSGIDLQHFAPAQSSPSASHETTFLFVGRLLVEKGVAELLEAIRMVRKTLESDPKSDAPLLSIRLKLVGGHDAHNPASVPRALIQDRTQAGEIEWLGTQSDVRPFMQQATCVVLPSYREGAPRALIEAAALGRPIIATDVPGCREVVQPGLNGLLCRPRCAQSLAQAMLAFIRLAPDERQRMGSASRTLATIKFDQERVVQAYLAALDLLSAE